MMIAASYSLLYEGCTVTELPHPIRTTIGGCIVGVVFILATKRLLERFEHLKVEGVEGASAQKMILIIFVMTLHSLSEGIGIGVSFGEWCCLSIFFFFLLVFYFESSNTPSCFILSGGQSGMKLGSFISLSLAMHNIPEGLAVALVTTSRRVSPLRAGLWAVFTSLPQPLAAVPAFLFVDRFVRVLPMGLGFASGAMGYVACMELIVEAAEDCGITVTALVCSLACAVMVLAQVGMKGVVV